MAAIPSAVLMRSAFSRSRKPARGQSRSVRAMRRSVSSGIAASHPRPKSLQRAELQLLDRSVGFVEPRGDVVNAALLDESLDKHRPLVRRQFADEPPQLRAFL